MKNSLIFVLGLLLFTLVSCGEKQDQKPNIIVILVDDAGYADFGFMGSEDLETPSIDRLAANGVIFTDAHVSASVCGPSRAGLLTGKYQQRFGFECNPEGNLHALSVNEPTLAEVLKAKSYTTAAFGKWHLGSQPGTKPNERGFDYYWGFLSGGRDYFPYKDLEKASEEQRVRENDSLVTFEGYLTDVLADKCTDFIHENRDNPFFIYWSPNAVHTPMQAKEEDLDRYSPGELLYS